MTDFDAQVKRTYSLHESFRLARGGLQWSPGKVVVAGSYLRVSTPTESQDIRPHRLAWKNLAEFSVSGVEGQGHLKRILLRFPNAEEAQALAEIIPKMTATVEVVTASLVEEVPVFVRFLYPKWITIMSAAILVAWIGFVVWVTILYSFVGFLLAIWFGTWIPTLVSRPLISRFSAHVKGPLVFQNQSVMLSVPAGPYFPVFSALEWQGSKQFVFKMGLKKVEIQFANENDAAKAFRMIRSRFSSVLDVASKEGA